MPQIAMYLAGSVVALLALDGVPPATQQVGTIAAALRPAPVSAPTALPITNVNRATKGDRLAVQRRPVQPMPNVAREPTPGIPPVGCDSSFSPVVSPSLAHIVGRCMVEIEVPQKFASLTR